MFNLLRKVKIGTNYFHAISFVQNLVEQMPPHQIKFEREAIELSLVKTFFSVTNWRINMCAA